jgi:hypothetical protein
VAELVARILAEAEAVLGRLAGGGSG